MKDVEFKEALALAHWREQCVGAALARKWRCTLSLSHKRQFLSAFDYILFDLDRGKSVSVEQKDSFKDKLCVEFETHTKTGSAPGWLSTTKADRLAWVNHSSKTLYFFNWPTLKDFILLSHHHGVLDFRSHKDDPDWILKHHTSPTSFALLDLDATSETLGEDVSVYSFNDLNLPAQF